MKHLISGFDYGVAKSMLEQWLKDIDYSTLVSGIEEISMDEIPDKTVEIYNLSGRRVASSNSDLQTIPSGIYLLLYNDGNNRKAKKLLINR